MSGPKLCPHCGKKLRSHNKRGACSACLNTSGLRPSQAGRNGAKPRKPKAEAPKVEVPKPTEPIAAAPSKIYTGGHVAPPSAALARLRAFEVALELPTNALVDRACALHLERLRAVLDGDDAFRPAYGHELSRPIFGVLNIRTTESVQPGELLKVASAQRKAKPDAPAHVPMIGFDAPTEPIADVSTEEPEAREVLGSDVDDFLDDDDAPEGESFADQLRREVQADARAARVQGSSNQQATHARGTRKDIVKRLPDGTVELECGHVVPATAANATARFCPSCPGRPSRSFETAAETARGAP